MTKIDAHGLGYRELNEELRRAEGEIEIDGCMGQRFIASGMSGKKIKINGIPGNALGAYLDGSGIEVMGNVQDAVGDTMNFGTIAVHGSAGDAVGYAMRGGEIYVRDNAGYRAGIHMKAYADRFPVIVIGGKCGSFLGEYQAGGLIIVLGNGVDDDEFIGHFCGTGMHGGRIFLRCREIRKTLPAQVKCSEADAEDIASVEKYLKKYEELFGIGAVRDDEKKFYVLRPNTKNPYKQLYVQN